jgi:hypothetical protein
MTSQLTFTILQYNIKNKKKSTMMSFLINSRIKKDDLLIIQKSWRNVCVLTFYNSFNIDFHLFYEDIENVKICFYINTRINVDNWFINYVFDDVCIIRIKIANKRWINVHNVYNVSLNFYASHSSLTIIEIVKNHLNDDEKHIFFERFQSASFAVKRRDKINSTQCNESIFECRSTNLNSARFIRRHYYLKNASFSKHDWLIIHDKKITTKVHSLHD